MFFPQEEMLQVQLLLNRSGSSGRQTWEIVVAAGYMNCEEESRQKAHPRLIRYRFEERCLQEDVKKVDTYGSSVRKCSSGGDVVPTKDHLSQWQGLVYLFHLFWSGSTREMIPQVPSSPHRYFVQRCTMSTGYSYQRTVSVKLPWVLHEVCCSSAQWAHRAVVPW